MNYSHKYSKIRSALSGVGKTYAMLMAARQAQSQGLNVLVGIAETHGRSETDALLEGLSIFPLKTVHYHGQSLKEFDLDRALVLRHTAERVDADMRHHRKQARIAPIWNPHAAPQRSNKIFLMPYA